MTAFPAQRLGLANRGVLREGLKADVTVFDPDAIRDRATFENPHQYSEGVSLVVVNGEIVFENGSVTRARPGQILYGPGAERSR
jgi:N-acyl-D-aspartate/D-glutamate deacylase